MTFLLPAFLVAGLLVGLPILLHLLRRKPKQEVRFPSLRFLRNVVLRESRKHRIHRWLVLALRCLVLLLIAAAFARPFFGNKLNPANRALVVLLDNSFSMQSGDRWPEAIAGALRGTQSLQPGDRLGVMVMNPKPTWLAPLSADLAAGRAALANAKPGYAATRYAPALKLAGSILDAAPESQRKILWIGDHQATGWRDVNFNQPLPAGIELEFSPSPVKPRRQAAIREARIRTNGDRLIVDVVVLPYLPTTAKRTISIFQGTNRVARQSIELRGEPLAVTVETQADAKRVDSLTVQLDADDLPIDDVRYAVAESRDNLPLRLSAGSGEVDYLAGALEVIREQKLLALKVGSWPPSSPVTGEVAFLRGGAPFAPKILPLLEAFLKKGGVAWIQLDGSPEPIEWLKRKGITVSPVAERDLKLRDWDLEHPLLAPFKGNNLLPLLSLQFRKGWGLKGESLVPIARWGNQSLGLAEFAIGDGKILISGFDSSTREISSWPVSSAFVPFVHGVAQWLAQGTLSSTRGIVGASFNLPAEGKWELLEGPESQPPREVSGSLMPLVPGIYQLTSGDQKWRFAINVPEEESNLAVWPGSGDWQRLQSPEARPANSLSATSGAELLPTAQPDWIWWWLILVGLILLMAELGLSNRTAA